MRNQVKETIASGGVSYGINVRLSHSGEIARIARSTGHEFLYIDNQHAIFDPETIAQIALAAISSDVVPFVRVRASDDRNLSLYLDSGVLGLVIPDVESVEQVRQVVNVTRFPPIGRRSFSGSSPHYDYAPTPMAQMVEELDSSTLIICMIESRGGLRHLEEIAAEPGVDGLYLGMADLMVDLGKAGQPDDPEVQNALGNIIDAAHRNGKFVGCGGVDDVERQVRNLRRGVQFLTTQSDLNSVYNGAAQAMAAIHAELAADRPSTSKDEK